MRPVLVFLAALLAFSCQVEEKTRPALVVIDMQNAALKSGAPLFNADNVVSNIRKAADVIRRAGGVVVFVKYNGSQQREFLPGTAGFEIVPELDVLPQDVVVEKTANDSFYQSNLLEVLKQHHAGKVYFCGTETDFCVNSTVQSALSQNLEVVVLEDAHTASDKGGLSGEQIVRYYNAVWKMLIPTSKRVVVESVAEAELK